MTSIVIMLALAAFPFGERIARLSAFCAERQMVIHNYDAATGTGQCSSPERKAWDARTSIPMPFDVPGATAGGGGAAPILPTPKAERPAEPAFRFHIVYINGAPFYITTYR